MQMMRAGHSWDAVRVPRQVAVPTLTTLGDESGAVIEDTWGEDWYWLISTGNGTGWAYGHGVTVLGAACWLAVPPASRTAGSGVRWILPPEPGRAALTSAPLLRTALNLSLLEPADPR